METRYHNNYINGRLNVRVPIGERITLQTIRVLGTDVVLLRDTASVHVSMLDPAAGDTLMLGSRHSTLRLRSNGDEATLAPSHPAAIMHSRVHIEAHARTDIVVAAVSRSEVRQLGVAFYGDLTSIKFFEVDSLLFLPFADAVLGLFARIEGGSLTLGPHHSMLLNVMGAGVLGHRPQQPSDAGERLTSRARVLIMQTHRDPRTTPASLATTLGVSLRTLQRAFSAEGVCVGDELRHARAKAARHFLQNDDRSRGRVARAAKAAGFRTVSSMHRALDAMDDRCAAPSATFPRSRGTGASLEQSVSG